MLVQIIKKNLRSKISLDCPFKMAERTVSSPVSQIHILLFYAMVADTLQVQMLPSADTIRNQIFFQFYC